MPGRWRQGAGPGGQGLERGKKGVRKGLERVRKGQAMGAWIPGDECRVSKKVVTSTSDISTSANTMNTRARTRGTLAAPGGAACGAKKERVTACARPARAGQHKRERRSSARLHQTSLSRHMSCTRTRRGAQPAPGEQRLPEPPIDAQRPLSLPVLLACIFRSMRLQRMMPIGSSSEFTSPQSSV